MDSAQLNQAVAFLKECGGANGVKRLVIVRNGRMIWRGPEADTRQGVWSVTKAFTSTAHGLLIEDGKCTLATVAAEYDPDLLEFLNQGHWQGRQLINSDWVREATSVQVPTSIPDALPGSNRKGSGVYGYHWWPNGFKPDGQRRWPDAPPSTYSRSGYNNNDLFVIPAWNMVTVRLGLDQREDDITSTEYNSFLRKLGEAITDTRIEGR